MSHAEGPYLDRLGRALDQAAVERGAARVEAKHQEMAQEREVFGRELTAAETLHVHDLMANHLLTREEALTMLAIAQDQPRERSVTPSIPVQVRPDDILDPEPRELVQVIHDLSLPPEQRAKGHVWLVATDARGQVIMAVEGVGGIERFEQDPVTAPRTPRDPATPGGIWYARFGMTEPRFHAGMQVEQEVSGERYARKGQEPRTYRTGNPGGGDAIRGEVLP